MIHRSSNNLIVSKLNNIPRLQEPFTDIGLYPFTTHTFTNAGSEGTQTRRGVIGPSLLQIRRAYARIPWAERFINMNNNDGIQLWTVPKTGVYTIRAVGAGSHDIPSIPYGRGRDIQTNVTLQRGNIIRILVGQRGMISRDIARGRFSMGGGGGTFIASELFEPIIVAGGGGGINPVDINRPDVILINSNANSTNNGNNGSNIHRDGIRGLGGQNGNGGHGNAHGAGGGGFFRSGYMIRDIGPGISFIEGGFGGIGGHTTHSSHPFGGFGGGGGGGYSGGGGGGGYSGGGGSDGDLRGGSQSGGGGGSYSINEMIDNGATNISHGRVIITFVK